MGKTVHIKCLNNNQTICYPIGTTLKEVAEDMKINLRHTIIAAFVNNRLAELSYELYHSKQIEFIDITHPDGMRMYIRSLSFVLYKASKDLFPNTSLRIEHSVSKGTYCTLQNHNGKLDIDEVLAIGERMREIIDEDIPFIRRERETPEVIAMFESKGHFDKTALLKHRGQVYSSYYKLDGCLGTYYGYLVPSTGYLKKFDLIKYYEGMLLQIPQRSNPDEMEPIVVQNKMFEIFREYTNWNRVLQVNNIGDLNKLTQSGGAKTLMQVSESLHEKKIGQIADMIESRKDQVKIILISGPSSSGKTTFGKRLAIHLMVAGMRPLNLSLDNYFVNREDTPLDADGKYDFEALEALNVEQFNQNLISLLKGEEVEIPKFNFESGRQYFDGESLKMHDENVLIIEGIHGLNPQLTHLIPNESKFKIYVSALTCLNIDDQNIIHSTDNRLIRRLVRDYKYRKYSAIDTISRWPSVRRGEELHIFPFQEEADVMFNTALLFEFAALKSLAEPILLEVQPNQPEYAEATRLLKFLGYFKPMQKDDIPPTSIIREFIGGSGFDY